MLVLSRRLGQKVLFPSLGIAIEVLRSRGSVTRLGIEAPESVPIMRDEVLSKQMDTASANAAAIADAKDRRRHHEWRNKLNHLMLKLQLLQDQLKAGIAVDPEQGLAEICTDLSSLETATTDVVMRGPSLKVLVVEDQANERELLATCLRQRGVTVATAANGREAFDYLHDHELPDLVLLDMRMPEVDGPTCLKLIRDDIRLNNLRVFAVSGSLRGDCETESLPIDGWFSKPVRIDALLEAAQVPSMPAQAKV